MPPFPATKRTVTRNGKRYQVWDEHPHRGENPELEDWDFWSAFETGDWEPELEATLGEHLAARSTFLDIGAWIGPVSLIAARMCSQVHAVEPDPVAHERLTANVGRQRRKNITTWPVALAAADGTVRIGRRSDRRFGDSMTSTIFQGDAIEVQARTLESLLADVEATNIGLIKMDIEGGEERVLPACVDTLRSIGAPLLLSTHALLVDDPDRYQRAITTALDGFDTTIISGRLDGLATILAVTR